MSNAQRSYQEVTSQRGTVLILKENEQVEGIYTGQKGREIGEEKIPTLEIYVPNEGLRLIPISAVIESKMSEAITKKGDKPFGILLKNLGKAKSKTGKNYHNFQMLTFEPTLEEMAELNLFELESQD